MLLLTFAEWIGPSRDYSGGDPMEPTERQVAFGTRLSLSNALKAVRTYEDTFNSRYYPLTAVSLRLLVVSPIEDVEDEELKALGVEMVEGLSSGLADQPRKR